MAILRGILAELGLDTPAMHSGQAHHVQWVTDRKFDPVEGAYYELAFARIPVAEDEPYLIKRIRVDGPTAEDWFDLDRNAPLDRALYAYAVKAFRSIDLGADEAGTGVPDGNLH